MSILQVKGLLKPSLEFAGAPIVVLFVMRPVAYIIAFEVIATVVWLVTVVPLYTLFNLNPV